MAEHNIGRFTQLFEEQVWLRFQARPSTPTVVASVRPRPSFCFQSSLFDRGLRSFGEYQQAFEIMISIL